MSSTRRRTPLRTDRAPHPRYSPELLATLAGRLTARDRHILRMLYEHRVLTTGQVDELAFGNDIAARHRLLTLYRLGATDRFRPWAPRGSTPLHHILAPAGAAVLAAEDGVTVADLGYRHDKALAIAHASTLVHTVDVNGLFTALTAHARRHPAAALLDWWSEWRCASYWGDLVRPDAYARWRDHHPSRGSAEVEFFLEYDTGTEPLDRVAGKLAGYTELAAATGISTLVLFHLHSPTREANLRPRLDLAAREYVVPAATGTPHTASDPHAGDPAGPCWLPTSRSGPRLRLADLADH